MGIRLFLGGKFDSVSQWKQFSSGLEAARATKQLFSTDIGFAISPIRSSDSEDNFEIAVVKGDSDFTKSLRHGGHFGLRAERTDKLILNELRLFLLND